MSVSGLCWDVEIPGRASSSFESARRRGFLTVETEEHGSERLGIPVAVARTMKARRESGELSPASRAELLFLLNEQSRRTAWSRIAKLVNRRDYSAHDLSEKLSDDGYGQQVRQEMVARAIDCGLVDDRRFGSAYARAKAASGWGIMRISQELARHGVDAESLPGWPDEYVDGQSEDERAYQLAIARRLPDKNAYEKLVRYLCSRGFGLPCAKRVARRVIDESELSFEQ